MAAFDWLNKLFQGSETTRGLSGAVASAIALDDANSFYNYRLRRHYTDADIAEEPHRLWFTNDDPEARTGLGPHLANAVTEGQQFADTLIVLCREDHDRLLAADPDAERTLSRLLGDALADQVREEGLQERARRLGVWLVRDGSEAINGFDFGMVEGEFITGITPNLYRTPGAESVALLIVRVMLPGVWNDYREVGRFYDDQVMFTLGSHWLDNFNHPSLREAALYRLQRDDDGNFFHIINPDFQDRFVVNTSEQDGTSILTVSTREGEPLAYMVLEIVTEDAPAVPELDLPDSAPDIAPPMIVDAPARGRGNRTIIPEAQKERIFTFQERGALLQKVHFSQFMLGYDVYLGSRGELGTSVEDPAATFEVRKKTVSIVANKDGLEVNGESLPKGDSVLIEGDVDIRFGNQQLVYRELRGVDADGWPYVGEIRRPASSIYMLWGRDYTIGRSRDCRVVLPDAPHNENIVWKPKVGDHDYIESKTDRIPKSRFYTDSIMVSSEHGAIELIDDVPVFACRSSNCYGYIRRDGEVLTLHPSRTGGSPTALALKPGDEVLIGNQLFQVSYTPVDAADGLVAGPAPSVSATQLVEALDDEDEIELIDLEDAPDAFEPEPPTSVDEPSGNPHNLPDSLDDEPPVPPPVVEVPERPRSASNPSFSDVPDPSAPPPPLNLAPPDLPDSPSLDDIPGADDAPDAFDLGPGSDDPDDAPDAPDREPSQDAAGPPQPPPLPVTDDAPGQPEIAQASEPEPTAEAPALAPPPAPPEVAQPAAGAAEAPAGGAVLEVQDDQVGVELGRPARLVIAGWMVSGGEVAGNTADAAIAVPEVRLDPAQRFVSRRYFELHGRGRRAKVVILDADEARLAGGASTSPVDDAVVEIIRRDDLGDEDFVVTLRFEAAPDLPDPRARMAAVNIDEPLVAGLFTLGMPLRQSRSLQLGGLAVEATYDGTKLTLSGYLDSYRTSAGFLACFVQHDGGRFQTFPEDGADITLRPGDRIIIGSAVYAFSVS